MRTSLHPSAITTLACHPVSLHLYHTHREPITASSPLWKKLDREILMHCWGSIVKGNRRLSFGRSLLVGVGAWALGFGTREGWRAACVGVGDWVLFGSLLSCLAACSSVPSSSVLGFRLDSLHTQHVTCPRCEHSHLQPPSTQGTHMMLTEAIGLAAQALAARRRAVSLGSQARPSASAGACAPS